MKSRAPVEAPTYYNPYDGNSKKGTPDLGNPQDCSTPLQLSAQQGHVPIVRILLDARASANQAAENDGTTPLLLAAQEGHVEVARLLLEAGASPEPELTDGGATPLHLAAQEGHVDVARLLLEAGSKVGQAKEDGTTPLHVAAEQGHVEMARILLDAGAFWYCFPLSQHNPIKYHNMYIYYYIL